MKVEVAVLGSSFLISFVVSVDVKQRKRTKEEPYLNDGREGDWRISTGKEFPTLGRLPEIKTIFQP